MTGALLTGSAAPHPAAARHGGSDEGELTPLMRQYEAIKADHRDAILAFRLGDFYEMFNEDAEIAAAVLDLTLTSRNNGKARRVPLAGFPAKAVDVYVSRLLAAGYKVAVCEQMEDPRAAKGIVRRAVVEVVTPGAVLDEALLPAGAANFLAAVAVRDERAGLAFADVSTGELWLAEAPLAEAGAELARTGPAEILVPASWCRSDPVRRARLGELAGEGSPLAALCGPRGDGSAALAATPATTRDDALFDAAAARERLLEHLGVLTLEGFGVPERSPAVAAAGAALAYLAEVQPQAVRALRALRWTVREEGLLLDEITLRNLEVVRPLNDGDSGATLLAAVDGTRTAPGARLLRAWLTRPLADAAAVRERQDGVDVLLRRGEVRAALRELLGRCADVRRIVSRCAAGRATPRDLGALRRTLELVPSVARRLDEAGTIGLEAGATLPPLLAAQARDLTGLDALATELGAALVDDPPVVLGEGDTIRPAHDAELDRLREARASGVEWIAALQRRERERTGIASLKVGYNRVFGYFIEVTKPNLAQVPDDYARKQTVANGERFVTPELKEMEARVLGAEERIGALEAELFGRLRERIAADAAALQRAGEALAVVDVLASFAEVAAERAWTRPEVVEDDALEIRGGRHPVVELREGLGRFVPNDLVLDAGRRILVLTGPNMAGKSTFLRQAGLLVLLAHAGSWVPADRARVGLTDRIFTRVGASDDLAHGRSTFLVEMVETANILRNAGPRSLVLLDEIGRGTATFDGLSLAWAVTEWLHENPRGTPRTVFATHYHELTELAALLPRVANAHVQVREWGDEIVFLKKVVDGTSDRSYGIQVARLAGVPPEVIERAREILANLEAGEFGPAGWPRRARGRSAPPAAVREQISLFEAPDPLRDELRALDLDGLRPLEALNLVAEWKRRYAPGGG